jgi:hypothetical protein
MSFLINQDGEVFEKHLVENTTDAAKAITAFTVTDLTMVSDTCRK